MTAPRTVGAAPGAMTAPRPVGGGVARRADVPPGRRPRPGWRYHVRPGEARPTARGRPTR
jgi:hypothetical protein